MYNLHKTRLHNIIHSAAYQPSSIIPTRCNVVDLQGPHSQAEGTDSTLSLALPTNTVQEHSRYNSHEKSERGPEILRHNMVQDNSPIASQPESLGLH